MLKNFLVMIKHRILNQAGVTLVEVLIAAALLGGLALLFARLTTDTMVTTQRVEASSEILSVNNIISQLLLDSRSCRNTFGGQNANAPFTIDAVRSQHDVPIDVIEVGETYGNERATVVSMEAQLDGALFDMGDGTRTGNLIFTVTYQRAGGLLQTQSNPEIPREHFIFVRTNAGGVIQECFSAEGNAIFTAKQEACENIGGVYDIPNDRCDLALFRDPNQNDRTMAISENYIRDLLRINTTQTSRITFGQGGGEFRVHQNASLFRVLSPSRFDADVTISDGNSLQMTSDERLKRNIVPLSNILEYIDELTPVQFDWRTNNSSDIGFIAQEVQKIFPDLVSTLPDGDNHFLAVKYPQLSALAIQAAKELHHENLKLKAKNRSLNKKVEELSHEVYFIKRSLCEDDSKFSFCTQK